MSSYIGEGEKVNRFSQASLERYNSMAPRRENHVTEIKLFDLNFKFCKNLTFDETLDFISQEHSENDPYVLLFLGLDDFCIINIRKQYDLHPILDSECSNSWLNDKDSILKFKDYFLITINDADKSDSLETPVSLKMIVFKSHILIFAEDELFCINKVFNKILNFNQFPSKRETKRVQGFDHKASITQPNIDIWNDSKCSKLESIFHKILEAIYRRLEKISLQECEKSAKCLEDSSNYGIDARVDFIINLTLSQKNLIYLEEVIRPKLKLFHELIEIKFFSEHFQYYLSSLETRTMVLVHQIYNNKILIGTAGKIFSKTIDNDLADSSAKLNDITKYFSSISTIFLPINLVAGLFGMNVMIPYGTDEVQDRGPFIAIVMISLVFFITLVMFFKRKGWM